MKEIRIEKITLNIGTGQPGPELDKAKLLLEKITGKKPIETKSWKRIPGWKVRPGLAIGTKLTLRNKEAIEVLKRLIEAVDKRISIRSFDKTGNLSFGVPEYLEIPGMEYIPEVGIIGLEVAVTLERPGYRVKKRSYLRRKIPARHQITKQEGIDYMKQNYSIIIKEEEDQEE
jgi:large subunit ribosomal protein L5